jgi:hypothetical protein
MSIFLGLAILAFCLGFMYNKIREEKELERDYNRYFGRE